MLRFNYKGEEDDEFSDRPSTHLHFNPSAKPRSKLGRRRLLQPKDSQVQESGSCNNLESQHQTPSHSGKLWHRDDSGFSNGTDGTPSITHPVSKTNSAFQPLPKYNAFPFGSSKTPSFRSGQENKPFSNFALPSTPFRLLKNEPLKEIVPNLVDNTTSTQNEVHSVINGVTGQATSTALPSSTSVQKQLNSSFCCDDSLPLMSTSDSNQVSTNVPDSKPNETTGSDKSNDSSFMTAHDINRMEFSTNRTMYDIEFLKTPGKNLAEIRIEESPFDPLKEFVESDDSGVGKFCDEKSDTTPVVNRESKLSAPLNSQASLSTKKMESASSDCESNPHSVTMRQQLESTLQKEEISKHAVSQHSTVSASVTASSFGIKHSDLSTIKPFNTDKSTSSDFTMNSDCTDNNHTVKVKNETSTQRSDVEMDAAPSQTTNLPEDDPKTVVLKVDKPVLPHAAQSQFQPAVNPVASAVDSHVVHCPSHSVVSAIMKPQPQNVITIKGISYTILSLLGKGGSSQVYQALGPQSSKLLAIKCVNLSQVEEAMAADYLNEIQLLSQLQGCPSVIKMFDHEYVPQTQVLYVVLEKGDIDFSNLVKNMTQTKDVSIPMVIYYWTEMLNAVNEIHKRRIIHSDLKPANFLLVEGRLKLIDFGIASSLQADTTSIMKDVVAGTHNYISPEAIRGQKITRKSDVWSMGCILYNLLYRRMPYSHLTNRWQKLHAIADLNNKVQFPKLDVHAPPSLRLALRWCLIKDPKSRPSVEELIQLSELSPHRNSALGKEMDLMMCQYFRRVIPNLREVSEEGDFI